MPIDLTVEILKVGPGGTETLATDQARVFLGKGALLARDVTLMGRSPLKEPLTEKLRLRAELRPLGVTQAGLALVLKSKVQVLALSGSGQIPRGDITRSLNLEIAQGASELVTVYESPPLDTKVTLHVKWSLAEDSEAPGADPTQVALIARVFEVGDSGETLLADHRLVAVVGHPASTTVDRLVPLPGNEPKKVRQDRLEITLVPLTLSGRNLSLSLEVSGEIATLTSEGNQSHPLAHQGNYLLSPGVPEGAELEVRSGSAGKEGWLRVRFRIEITALF
ncbi:MAG: hypothetical protein L0Z52_09305 [Acidobacteria bacterium]|nr:hypothetical protein [Acidobacteriota bacterium]